MSSTIELPRAEATRAPSIRQAWSAPALIASSVCLLYLATVGFQFVYDDSFQILENPWLSWRHIPLYFTKHVWAFTGVSGVYWRPLFLLWMLFQHMLFGINPAGYHAATVVLHAVATALVYRFSLRLTRDHATAVIAALIFGVHPVMLESVAWVSGCTDPLLACCFIPAFLSFVNWREKNSRGWLLASLGWYALALMAKEPAVMLLPLLFLYAWLQAAGLSWLHRTRAAIVSALPHLCLTIVYAGVHSIIEMRMASGTPGTPLRMLLTAPKLLLFYVRLLVFPWPVSPEYDMKLTERFGVSSVLLPALGMIAIALAIIAWIRHLSRTGEERAAQTIRFASLWMLVPIVPVLNIAAITPYDFAHARYLYTSCIGFAIIVAFIVRRIPDLGKRVLGIPFAQAAAAAAIVGILAFANVMQQPHWGSNLLLFYYGVHIAPHNPIALTGLATEVGKRKQYDKALALLQDSMDQDSSDPHTNFTLGYTYLLMGRYKEAEFFLQRGVSLRPEDTQADQFAYYSMAELKLGNLNKAEWAIRQAMKLQPDIEKYHYALGLVLEQQGKQSEAASAFKDALAINPANADARQRLARMQNTTN